MDNTQFMSLMICLTGMVIIKGMVVYSSVLHSRKIWEFRANVVDTYKTQTVFQIMAILSYVPLAIVFQSTFMGYITFGLIFNLIGFRMTFFGLGYMLGFDN